MKQGCLWLLLFAAWSASAQPVYKCTNAEGGNSYQSTPCAEGEASTSRAHVAPASGYMPTTTAPLSAHAQSAPLVPGERRAQARHGSGAANATCDGARAQRTATLGAAGAAPPAELRTRLDQAVQDACG